MSLQKQLVPVTVPQGINTKSAGVFVPMQQAMTLDNVQITKLGELKKRHGFDAIAPLPSPYKARGVFDLDGKALVIAQFTDPITGTRYGLRLFEYIAASNSYIDRGNVGNWRHSLTTQTYDDEEQVQVSCDLCGSYYVVGCVTYRTSVLQGVKVFVFDSSKTSALISSFTIASQDRVKVCKRNDNSAYITTALTGNANLSTRVLNLTTLSLGSPVTTASNLSTSAPNFDVKFHKLTQKAIIAYNTGTSVVVAYLTTTGAQEPSPTPLVLSSHNGSAAVHVNTYDNQTNRGDINIVYARDSSPFTITLVVYPFNWVATPSVGPYTQAPPALVRQLTSDTAFVYAEITPTVSGPITNNPWFHYVRVYAPNPIPSGWDVWDTIRGVGLRSEADSANLTVALASETLLQPTAFLYSAGNRQIVAKFNALESGGLAGARGPVGTASYSLVPSCLSKLLLPTENDLDFNQFTLFTTTKTGIISSAGQVFGTRNIARLDFDRTQAPQGVVSRGLYLAGSQVDFFDGRTLAEAGFYLFPENCVATVSGTAGTSPAGAYGWAVTFSFEDAYGNRWESAPQLGNTTLTTNQQIQLVIPQLRVTNKTNVVINTYRTTANGSILYRCDAFNLASAPTITYSPTNPLFNDKTTDTVTVFLNPPSTDTAIESNAILYTTGGVLENDQPPSCTHISLYRGRMFYTGLEKKQSAAYSKFFNSFEPANFNATYTLEAGTELLGNEGLTASQTLDDKLLLFSPTAILALSGQGPLNTGLQSDFDRPVLIATDVGCVTPQSIVLYSNGLLFKSNKGIYQINRGLQVEYIGAPVEDFNSLAITSSSLIDDKNEVRFTTTDKTLVYNYFFNQWMTHSLLPTVAGAVVGGIHTLCLTDGRNVQETSQFTDSGTYIKSTLATGWLSPTLQGFTRIYRALFIGDIRSNCHIVVRLYFDFDKFYKEQFLITSAQMFPQLLIGEQPFGQGLYGGEYTGYCQFMVMPSHQKCQSFKIEIEDSPQDSGEGLVLNGITLQVGMKQGTQKLPATKRATQI